MPHNYEIILGFPMDQGREIWKQWGCEVDPDDDSCDYPEAIEQALRDAFDECALAQGWTRSESKPRYPYNEKDNVIFETQWGLRMLGYWMPYINFDSDEVGDRYQDGLWGLSLTSRYKPSILDAEDPHGCLPHTWDLRQILDQAEACKAIVVKHLPEFADAKIYYKDIFY